MLTPAYAPTATERVLPRLALDFTTASLDARVTVTRALNTATRVNSSGFIAGVNANLPRFDYDPITLACKGLLIEESRANAFTYSQDFGNAIWVRSITNVSTDVAVSPDGTTNADSLIPTTATGNHSIRQPASLTNGVVYTMSGFFKANGYRRVMLRESTAFGYAAVFDLISGTVVGTSSATGTITNFGNGWYRCQMTFTSEWTNTSDMNIFVMPDNGTSYATASFTGDGTSNILAYGAQLEAGAFPTSYIPTTTTSVTRNADVVSMTGTNFSSWYNASEGTFVATSSTINLAASRPIFQTSTAGVVNGGQFVYYDPAGSRISIRDYDSGGSAVGVISYTGAGTPAVNTNYCMAFAYKTNSFAAAANGNAVAQDTTGTVSGTPDALYIGRDTAATYLNGYVRKINFYTMRLTNAEVQSFSKG